MIDRTYKSEEIGKLTDIVQRYGEAHLESECEKIERFRDLYVAKAVFMGNFNAGKSALINRLLGRSVMEEAQRAKTTIATELFYSEDEEKLVAVNLSSGKKTLADIKDRDSFSGEDYDKALMYLNCDILTQLDNTIVVDMPGYNSGNPAHNKAISRYIGENTFYLYVKDSKLTGGLTELDIAHISELMSFGGQTALIMNKTDLFRGDPKKLEEVKENVREQLEMYDIDIPVYWLSRDDSNISETLKKIILSFDAQSAFDKKIDWLISAASRSIKSSLVFMVENMEKVNNDDINLRLYRLKTDKDHILEEFNRRRQSDSEKYIQDTVNNLMQQIKAALLNCKPRLVSAVINQAPPESVSAIISEAVRPIVLEELNSELSSRVSDIINSVNCGIEYEPGESFDDILIRLAENAGSFIREHINSDALEEEAYKELEFTSKKNKHHGGNDIYHAVTGALAIGTSFVAPEIEILIILLPDLIRLAKSIFGDSDEDIISSKIDTNIFPLIESKMREQLEKYISEYYYNMLDQLESEFKERIEGITSEIEQLCIEKQSSTEKYENKLRQLQTDIGLLDKLAEE